MNSNKLRAVAEGKDPSETPVRDVMSKKVLYCYEDQDIEDVAENMGHNQVRRLPVLNRQKRLVGIISLADIALPKNRTTIVGQTLGEISETAH